jgi:hypothetical protein
MVKRHVHRVLKVKVSVHRAAIAHKVSAVPTNHAKSAHRLSVAMTNRVKTKSVRWGHCCNKQV